MLLASLVSKHGPPPVQSCDVLPRLACCYVILPSAVTVSKDYDCLDGEVGFRCYVCNIDFCFPIASAMA